jgi:hypothetical protein
MHLDGYPGSSIFLVAGVMSLLFLVETALVIPLRKRRVILAQMPMAQVNGQLHTVLAVGALAMGLFHGAGHFDADKSGTWLLISIMVTTALGITGRVAERLRFSDALFSKLWRQAHRLSTWTILGCLLWHLIAVLPLIF